MTLFPAGRQRVTGCGVEHPADFCGETRADFGAEVYRKRTGGSGLGKSAGKELRGLREVERSHEHGPSAALCAAPVWMCFFLALDPPVQSNTTDTISRETNLASVISCSRAA